MPDKFVLKITQSSGYNIICPDKSSLDKTLTIQWLKKWQKISNESVGLDEESYVFNGHSKIICEMFLENKNGDIPSIDDYL